MVRRLGTWVFLVGLAGSAALLWTLSTGTWGRIEEYSITGRQMRVIGTASPVTTPRLSLQPLHGEAQRQPIEVPQASYDAVREGDVLRVQTRFIPLLQGELVQYAIVRAGSSVMQWDEGWPFYGFALVVGSGFGAAVIFGAFLFISSVLRLKPPSE